MSDKPIQAEIDITKLTLKPTEAKYLKPGNRCIDLDDLVEYEIREVKSVGESDGEFLLIDFGGGPIRMIDDAIYFVILPEPVEVREFWLAECHSMTKEGAEQECRDWLSEIGYPGTLEELTVIVKSREEVKP